MPKPSSCLDNLKGQPMFQILAECRELESQGRRVMHFELGDPDFDTPSLISDACIQSLRSGNTHYMPARGSEDLIEAVRMTTGLSRGFIPSKNQITITTGANSAIFYALKSVANPNDEVLIPNPYFPSYLAAAEIAGVKTQLYELLPEDGFSPCIESIQALINPRTKAILVNSPSNPTGSVLSPQNLRDIYDIAQSHDIYVISDEVYARMVFDADKNFSSPSAFDSCKERTIIINGFSKAFANISQFSNDSESFALHLLKTSGVATVPGIYFGSKGESHLRLSCAGSDQDIADLADCFHNAVITYSGT